MKKTLISFCTVLALGTIVKGQATYKTNILISEPQNTLSYTTTYNFGSVPVNEERVDSIYIKAGVDNPDTLLISAQMTEPTTWACQENLQQPGYQTSKGILSGSSTSEENSLFSETYLYPGDSVKVVFSFTPAQHYYYETESFGDPFFQTCLVSSDPSLSIGSHSAPIKVTYRIYEDANTINDQSASSEDFISSTNITINATGIAASTTSIEASKGNIISLFPNPSKNKIYSNSNGPWVITNLQGIQILSGNGSQVNISNLPSGSYIFSQNGHTELFIKE